MTLRKVERIFLLTVILTIVLYANVVDYNVDNFISPFMSLENLNDEERK